jgi:dipeptidyl aminopeptidase/acylaminoacyl peptidase
MHRLTRLAFWLATAMSIVALAACGGSRDATPQPLALATPSATPPPTWTPTSAPATTPPSPTPTATSTPQPTPTPTPLHPLSIAAMRARQYPGSEITIEETLEPGSNYRRYIASYRSEGLKIYALLTIPMGEKPATGWPVIVFNHGYIPPAQYRTTERYIAYVDAFARNGYIVFRPDYRGHGNSEGVATGGYGSPDYTVDVLNALASIKAHPDANPERIGMWGHSMGGFITLRAMVTVKDIKAGVIWAGVVASYPDLLTRWRRPAGAAATVPTGARRWRDELIAQYGTPEENPSFWAEISANTYVRDLSGPVQLHHGTADTSVPVEFSEILFEQIQTAGGEVELYTYEGDNHNISNNFRVAMQRSVAFFDAHLR